jgi:hypothetical protein
MRRWIALIGLLMASLLAIAEEPVSTGFFSKVAIGGIDTVAYHEVSDGHEVKGSKKITYEWKGAIWRFADQASRDKFAANPEAWIPEFNGFCANALSLDEGLVRTDGTVWAFFDDKLYLFYAQGGLDRWQGGDFRDYRKDAERAWQAILEKP